MRQRSESGRGDESERGQGPEPGGPFRSWYGLGCILGFILSAMGCHCGSFPHVSSNSLVRLGVATLNA